MKVNVENKKYDYEGCHATGDILLNEYPENMIELVRDCIKYSNLTVVSEHIKQFTPEAATVVWILSESHFSLHEYPENNYITVDCYTCGEEGDPLAAINNLIKTLDDLVGIKDKDVKFFKRGEFNKSKVLVDAYDFVNTEKEEYEEIQKKLDNISKSLTAEQVKDLQEVLNITKMTNTLKETELKLNIKFGDFYKDFLLKGSDEIVKDTFDFIGSNGKDSSDVLDFFFVNNNEEYSILNRTNYFKNRIPEHFIVIGHDSGGNLILMEKLTEEIYFWDHELENEDADMSNCYFLAKNFKEFFEEKLYEYVLENDEED